MRHRRLKLWWNFSGIFRPSSVLPRKVPADGMSYARGCAAVFVFSFSMSYSRVCWRRHCERECACHILLTEEARQCACWRRGRCPAGTFSLSLYSMFQVTTATRVRNDTSVDKDISAHFITQCGYKKIIPWWAPVPAQTICECRMRM